MCFLLRRKRADNYSAVVRVYRARANFFIFVGLSQKNGKTARSRNFIETAVKYLTLCLPGHNSCNNSGANARFHIWNLIKIHAHDIIQFNCESLWYNYYRPKINIENICREPPFTMSALWLYISIDIFWIWRGIWKKKKNVFFGGSFIKFRPNISLRSSALRKVPGGNIFDILFSFTYWRGKTGKARSFEKFYGFW